jgi:hypothetical protein
MATNISSRTTWHVRPLPRSRILMCRILNSIHITIPRPRTLFTAFLFFGGLSVPVLMALSILPLNFVICFIGFAMTAVGGTLALVFCGEIY